MVISIEIFYKLMDTLFLFL